MSKKFAANVIRADDNRLDADKQGILWEKQLTLVEAEVTKKEYADNKMREVLPVDTTGGPGVKSREWRVMDRLGAWAMLAGYAGNLPLIGLTGEKKSAFCQPFGAAYGWSQEDADAMLYGGQNLEADSAIATRDAYEDLFESVGFSGHAAGGLQGLKNHPNIPVITGGGTWASATADAMIADITAAFSFIESTSKGKENPKLCLMPIAQFNYANTKRIGSDTKDTVMAFLRETYKDVVFAKYHALATADAAGTGPRIMLISQDKSRGYLWEPSTFRPFPMERQLLQYLVAVTAKLGGFICKRPLGFCYIDNV